MFYDGKSASMIVAAYFVLLGLVGVSFLTKAVALVEFNRNSGLFMGNFLNYISAPKRIIAFDCMERHIVIGYEKYFMEAHFQVTVLKIAKGIPKTMLNLNGVVFFVNLRCHTYKDLLDKARDNSMFRKSNIWVFFGEDSKIKENYCFSKFHRAFICQKNGSDMDVHQILQTNKFPITSSTVLVYKWSLVDEMVIYKKSCQETRPNLMKRPIKVSYALIHNESYQHLTDYKYSQQDLPSKITYLLMEQICVVLNATHVPIFRGHWGTYDNVSNTFTPFSMFSDIQNGFADIAGNTAATTYNRLKHFRFLASTGIVNVEKLKWVFRAQPLSWTQNIWTLPFVKNLWLATIIVLLIWYIALAAVATCELKLLGQNRINERSCWFVAFDIVITTLTQRGSYITFSTWSGKMICYSLFILIVLLNIAYTADLSVLLQGTGQSIHNFEDLLKSGMLLGSHNEPYNIYYFTNQNDLVVESMRQKIYRFIAKEEYRFWFNVSEGIQRVKDGVFAFHIASSVGYEEIAKTYDEATKRSIRSVDSIITLNNYICVSKNSTLADYLTYGFLYVHEIGVLRREQNKLFTPMPSPDFTKAIFKSLDINDVLFIFFILVFGQILSIIILAFEVIKFRFL